MDCLDVIRVQKKILTITGLWPERERNFFLNAMETSTWILSFALLITLVAELVNCYNNYRDFSEMFLYTVALVAYLFKMISFKMNKKEFLVMSQLIRDPVFASDEFRVRKVQKKIENLFGVFASCASFVIVSIFLKPLFGYGDLPMRLSFELGRFVPFVYAFQVVCTTVIIINYIALELLAPGLMAFGSLQFKILSEKITAIENFEKSSTPDDLNELFAVLYQCVEYHVKIIRFVDSIQKIFTGIFIMQFLEGLLCICNVGFQLAHVTPGSIQFYIMICYFFGKLQQIGLYCWFGNRIIEESSKIGYSCFKSQWYKCGPKVRKTLFLIMERAKRPTVLTAGKFSKISLASFMGLLNTSYSYFTLMQRLYKNSQEKD